jgi:FAD:protein FMN transferase
MKPAHHFQHEAMRTTFHIRFAESTPNGDAIAKQCFDQIDFLEARLSRYRQDSDIARINLLPAGETHFISIETHQCLLRAIELYQQTAGLFDITLGRQIRHRKDSLDGPAPEAKGQIIIHPDKPAVTCVEPGRELDLGGIGKGFALDSLHTVMEEWDAPSALLSAGSSTHLTWGPAPWPMRLESDQGVRNLELKNASLSASGTEIQGSHIVHPDAEGLLAEGRAWVVAKDATTADAWSTALILCPHEETREFVHGAPGILEVIRQSPQAKPS